VAGIAFTCDVKLPTFVLWESFKPVEQEQVIVIGCKTRRLSSTLKLGSIKTTYEIWQYQQWLVDSTFSLHLQHNAEIRLRKCWEKARVPQKITPNGQSKLATGIIFNTAVFSTCCGGEVRVSSVITHRNLTLAGKWWNSTAFRRSKLWMVKCTCPFIATDLVLRRNIGEWEADSAWRF
jgi:hypothetical protein